jgi:hypothetical protein
MSILTLTAAILLGVLVVSEVIFRYRGTLDAPAFEDSPDYGYLMRPNQSVSPRGLRFRINQHGFRGADFAATKPPGVTRIAFVGCSVTYGGGSIPDEALFVNRVVAVLSESSGSKWEGINLSAPGWGIQNMASCLSRKGFYGADVLVWMISAADFRRPKTTRMEYGFWRIRSWSRVVYGVGVALYLLNRNARYSRARALAPRRSPAELLEDNLRALEAGLLDAARFGLRQLIVVVPMAEPSEEHDMDARKFEALARERSVPLVHAKPVLEEGGLFLDHVHLSIRGHELIAGLIATAIGNTTSQQRRDGP